MTVNPRRPVTTRTVTSENGAEMVEVALILALVAVLVVGFLSLVHGCT